MNYRRDIDGLRALAVIPVVFFHAGFSLFQGGFVGVDIFFVISGYLITTIIVNELERENFSIISFYERRARRILPALFFVIFCCIPFSWAWMTPSQLEAFSLSTVSVGLFISNVFFWTESGYFDSAAEEKPLLHTWSLAVEEQYYMFFPIFLLILWRYGRSKTLWTIIFFAAASLVIAEWGWRNKPTANFYLAPSRAWELLVGAIAAFAVREKGTYNSQLMSSLGVGMILYSIFIFDDSVPFPSLYSLIPVTGAALIIIWGGPKTISYKLLGYQPFVWVGLVSYSAYLWHQPLFAFARIRLHGEPSSLIFIGLVALTFILAFFSWRFVERPFRSSKGQTIFRPRRILLGSVLGLSLLILLGTSGYIREGFPERLSNQALSFLNFESDKNPYTKDCLLHERNQLEKHPMKGCSDFFIDGNAKVMLIGDSHSDAISYQVQTALKKKNIGSYAVSYSGCVGVRGLSRMDRTISHECDKYSTSMIEYALSNNIDTLVLTSRFQLYSQGERFDNKEGGVEKGDTTLTDITSNRGTKAIYDEDGREERVLQQFRNEIKNLTEIFNVVLVYPIPEAGWKVPEEMAKCEMLGYSSCNLNTLHSVYIERTKKVNRAFDNIKSPRLYKISPESIFCNREIKGRCETIRNNKPLYSDEDHLANSTGALILSNRIVEEVILAIQGHDQ